ncbi:anti-sigma factor [Nocardioides campestrisoli]|uniref:zf-HC2 domain-containing protein n=1 Tax=Nocardioides campestrisoli TaxID=2736757 RepID=UPI00163DC0FC|nr:zf-HC2 domain-containing protein [Nocardioides campestrisoli]
MIGHLGTRVSALLDGCLSPAEEERAWEHVHACHPCRDAVEREGWVKTRLAELTHCSPSTPPGLEQGLRRSLMMMAPEGASPMERHALEVSHARSRSRPRHLAALGGGAAGVAVVGVLALGSVPANAPQTDRRGPVTSMVPPSTVNDTGSTKTPPARPSWLRPGGVRATLVP